jgi:hypothetical protein
MPAIRAKDGEDGRNHGAWRIVILKRSDVHRFVILSKRWIVERTLAWISRKPTPHARF